MSYVWHLWGCFVRNWPEMTLPAAAVTEFSSKAIPVNEVLFASFKGTQGEGRK